MPLVIPPPLESARLRVRLVVESDLPALLEVNGDEEVNHFLPYALWRSLSDAEAWYERAQGYRTHGTGLVFVLALKETDVAIGTCQLFRFEEGSARAELGYVLGRKYWSGGYMREALETLFDAAFQEMGLRRIEAEVDPQNVASGRLLLRLGFTKEGLLHHRWVTKGEVRDVEIYRLLRHEWPGTAAQDLFSTVRELPPRRRSAGDQDVLATMPAAKPQRDEYAEGMRLGPYRVLSELGRGGMGAVYLAVRDQPEFTQKVAIKLIKRGMDTDEIVRRFVAERQILASLTHSNIARLLDGGSTPEGLPYFVMEYVEGRRITAYADGRKLSVEDRLQLWLQVCRAVQHAHQSLVVHRDLKPANILVDAEGRPKLLDFGIAKLLDPDSSVTALTGEAPSPMTPEYASPEQRAGGPITTATDVYGLGLLLYELLVGQSPKSAERKLGAGWAERPPSEAIVALRPPEDHEGRRLARRIAGDLDTIAGKALENDPARRYGTAAALAEDVERHLARKPVTARRPTLRYRLSRILVRHKAAAVLAFAVCVLGVITGLSYQDKLRQGERAEAQRQNAEALNKLYKDLIGRADPSRSLGGSPPFRQILDAASEDLWKQDSGSPPDLWARKHEDTGGIYKNLGLYEQAERHLLRALELLESLKEKKEADLLTLADTLTSLGTVRLSRNAYPEAREAFDRALALKERYLGQDDPALAEDLNGLGEISMQEGHLEEARQNFDRACSIGRQPQKGNPLAAAFRESRLVVVLRGEPPSSVGDQKILADCYNNLGYLAYRQEDFPRAQFLFSKALPYYRSTLTDSHPETVLVRGNLAAAMAERGDDAGAEAHLREIVEIYKRLLPPSHPDLADALLTLAIYRYRLGRLDDANATLADLRQRRGDDQLHGKVAAGMWNLTGRVAVDRGDLTAADAAFSKSYEIYKVLPGDQRSNLANVLIGRADLHLLRQDFSEALALARRGYELARSPGVQSPDTVARTETIIGRCYLALQQPSLAEPYLESSYNRLLSVYGPKHPATEAAARVLQQAREE